MDNIDLSLVHTDSWGYLFHEIPSSVNSVTNGWSNIIPTLLEAPIVEDKTRISHMYNKSPTIEITRTIKATKNSNYWVVWETFKNQKEHISIKVYNIHNLGGKEESLPSLRQFKSESLLFLFYSTSLILINN